MKSTEDILDEAGVRVTSNRLLVLRAILNAPRPMSLADLTNTLETLEKSSVLKVLNVFLEHHLVHTIEDGRGIVRYEICHEGHQHSPEGMHVHFYCERCHTVHCLTDVPVPPIPLSGDYQVTSANFMLKGLCPKCKK